MSHFIGLVFVDTSMNTLDEVLKPYSSDLEISFEDRTKAVMDAFMSLSAEDPDAPCDRKRFPTERELAIRFFGYGTHMDDKGMVRFGFLYNPETKWDWYAVGNRWDGYIEAKNGAKANKLSFDEINFDAMKADPPRMVPFCFIDLKGVWHEAGQMCFFAIVANKKDDEKWREEVILNIDEMQKLPASKRKNVVVYAVDFHI